ncbi:MAG: crotonase/enoyl-CoA hydratase family protein [Myxococcota bacterium]|nr:crotonase/enoyl-CoA hydratase family protein [Myxococcota bacterium]
MIEYVRHGSVATIIIDRPHRRNAIDGPHAVALYERFEQFEADGAARVAVLTGAGQHFCAGADLKAIADGHTHPLSLEGPAPMGPSRMTLSKPVICAISGYAVAGGLELALWCDLRIADRTAKFGVFCRRWGVPLIDGGTVRLPRVIGMGRALDMILTGRAVDANEALDIGLVNRVVPVGTARAVAEELARQLSRFPQDCLLADRQSVYAQSGRSEKEALEFEFSQGRTVLNETARAGAAHFAQGAGRGGRFEHDQEAP